MLKQRFDLPDHESNYTIGLREDLVVFSASTDEGEWPAYFYEPRDGKYVLVTETWGEPAEEDAASGFGWKIALYDGEVLVSDPLAERPGSAPVELRGLVHRFRKDRGQWRWFGRIEAPDGHVGEYFGQDLSVSGDELAVGEPGVVTLFRREGGAWKQTATIPMPDPAEPLYFGWKVVLRGDRLVVPGSKRIHQKRDAFDPPIVHVFARTAEGWRYLTALEPDAPTTRPHFGASVAANDRFLALTAFDSATPRTLWIYELASMTRVARAVLPLIDGERPSGKTLLMSDTHLLVSTGRAETERPIYVYELP